MTDNQIIELYEKRDEQAIRETDRTYGKYCYKIADNILHNHQDSEECVSDTWYKVWNLIPPNRPTHLSLYCGRITRNLSFDRWRKKHANKRNDDEMDIILDELVDCIPAKNDVEGELIYSELVQVINSFLLSEKSRERSMFVKRYYYAESVSDIARQYNLKESNVLVILSRIRKRLQMYLDREGYGL